MTRSFIIKRDDSFVFDILSCIIQIHYLICSEAKEKNMHLFESCILYVLKRIPNCEKKRKKTFTANLFKKKKYYNRIHEHGFIYILTTFIVNKIQSQLSFFQKSKRILSFYGGHILLRFSGNFKERKQIHNFLFFKTFNILL